MKSLPALGRYHLGLSSSLRFLSGYHKALHLQNIGMIGELLLSQLPIHVLVVWLCVVSSEPVSFNGRLRSQPFPRNFDEESLGMSTLTLC